MGTNYIWFWTFWHWARENFRARALLRGPLHGIGGHWDEWFRHESSDNDRLAVEQVGRNETAQRQFILWLCRHWAPDIDPARNQLVSRFVLCQLAHVAPFDHWAAFARYRTGYGIDGVYAVVLADKSSGEAGDVRAVEALTLPEDADISDSKIVAEGFSAEAADLQPALDATRSLLGGKALAAFLVRWIISGRRPYPLWLTISLVLGWLATVGLILFLLFGPEPGERLVFLEAALVALWLGLLLVPAVVLGVVSGRAWQIAKRLRARLDHSHVRLRMSGGLTIKGGSAGLPFCLNILSSVYRAHPQDARRSWLWRQFFRKLCNQADSSAATGVITADGRIKHVVLESKLRACLKQEKIRQILTPNQLEAKRRALDAVANGISDGIQRAGGAPSVAPQVQLGFAAEKSHLFIQKCRDLGSAVMALGQFSDRRQLGVNIFALIVSVVMLIALPDLRSVLAPHPAPVAVSPESPSPYVLWVSLDTKYPRYFSAVMESEYWSNRREKVTWHDDIVPSMRAEIPFHRLTGMTSAREDDGVVWIERRRHFLTREFLPGERVAQYSIPYLSHIGHE